MIKTYNNYFLSEKQKFMLKGVYLYMIVVQQGPTCGIYAFLNGIKFFFSLKKLNSAEMNRITFELLKRNKRTIENKDEEGKTFIGEFFTMNDYLIFLNNNYKFIVEEIEKSTGSKVSFRINEISINDIETHSNALFICSILASNKKNEKGTLHWISFLSRNCGKYKIMDSRYKFRYKMKAQKILLKHNQLHNNKFCWTKFNEESGKEGGIYEFVRCRLKQKEYFIEKGALKKSVQYEKGKIVLITRID